MKKIFLAILIVSACSYIVNNSPEAKISNGVITAKLYLPDAEKGYYRGQRFDWAGQVYALQYKKHSINMIPICMTR